MLPGKNGASARKKPPHELLKFVVHIDKPAILPIARAFVGVAEEGSNNSGVVVEAFQKIVGDAHGEPWCMAFIQAVIAIWEARTGKISPFPVTEHCQKAANEARRLGLERTSLRDVRPGDVVIWRRLDSTMGHAEIVAEISVSAMLEITELLTVGGNTGAADPRDGEGVYLKTRVTGLLPRFKYPEFYRAV